MRISYSSFETYNRCPAKFKFQYVDWVKVPERPEFFFGGLIHETIQMALRRDPIIPKLEDLNKYYQSKWREDVFPTKLESDQYFAFGTDMLKNFYESYKPGLRKIVATEKRFQIPIGNHTLSGIIDRVDKLPFGTYEIIDYKTNKALPTQEEVDSDKQLGIYNFASQILWPEVKEARLTLYFLKHDTQISTTRTEIQVEEIKKEIIETADKIDKDKKFEPHENQFCPWCDYKHLCPIGKNLKKDETESPLEAKAQKFSELKKELEKLEIDLSKLMKKKNLEQVPSNLGVIYRLEDGCLILKDLEN